MKRLVTFTLLLTTLLLTACSSNDKQSGASEQTSKKTLTLGVMPSNDNIPLIVAQQQGFDKKHGIKLKLENFKSPKERDAAFQAGKVDGINSDLVAIALAIQGGMDVKITGSTYGTFDLVSNDPKVQTLSDLKGQDVLLTKNNSTEYAVDQMLKKGQVSNEAINRIDLPQVPTRLEMLKNHKAAAAILPEPFTTMGKADGMKVLASTREIGINPFVMAFENKTINKKSKEIRAMYAAYNDATTWMKENDKENYIDLFIKDIGFPESLKDQIQVPDYPKASQTTKQDVETAFAWAQEKGLLKKEIQPKDVLSDVYFK